MMATMNDNGENGRSLPDGWELSTLGESCDIVLGQSPSSDTYNSDGIGLPFYQGKTEFGDLYPTPEKWCSSPKKLAEKDDILISVRAPVGPTNLCPEKSCIGRGLAALRPKNMPTKYFLHYLRYIEKEWDSKATGTTFKAITGDVLRNQKIPLPPLPEQERIVNRIEELLSDLDAGVAALERVRVGLKRYKTSVLKAALTGKLFNGKSEISEDKLPEGWRLATIEEASERIVDCLHSTPKFTETGKYCVDTTWIKPGRMLFENARFVSEETFNDRIRRLKPITGDILFSREGTIGTALLVPENIELCLGQRMMMFRPNNLITSEFMMWMILSPVFINQWKPKIIGTTSPHINIGDIRQMIFPLPPLDEQRRIVAEVERRLSVVGEVESAVEVGLVSAARLRQSVLKSAFEGKLS